MFDDYILRLQSITFSMKNTPQVGLFWFDKDKSKIILHRYADANEEETKKDWLKLLEDAKGNVNKNWISVTPRHRELWSRLKEKELLDKLKLPEEFNKLPRGRILKDIETGKFILYYGNWLNDKTFKIICKKFNLKESDFDLKFGYNPEHYNYAGAENDLDSLREFLYSKGVSSDSQY